MSTAAGRVAQRAPAKKPVGRTQRAPVKRPAPSPRGVAVPKPAGPAQRGSAPSAAKPRSEATPRRRQPSVSASTKRIAVSRSTVVFVVITGVIVVAIMLGLVALNALLAQTSFKISDLQTRIEQLTQSYQQRSLQAAQVSSPAHLAKVAAQLGLVVPQGGVVILTPPPAGTARSTGKAVGGKP